MPRDSWPTDVFNILDFGGETDTYDFDNGAPLREALKAAEENGGGVVYFPRGFYHMDSGNFTIPENTVIRGEGMNLVSVYWGGPAGAPWNVDSMPSYIFRTSKGNCALEGISFAGTMMPEFFDCGQTKKYDSMASNVYVDSCRIWSNLRAGNNGYPKETEGREGGLTDAELEAYRWKDTMMFLIRCDNFQLTNCELEWDECVIGANDIKKCGYLTNTLISGNKVAKNGFYPRYDGVIFEDNTIDGATEHGGFECLIYGEKCYFTRNSFTQTDTAIDFCGMPCFAGTVVGGNVFNDCAEGISAPTDAENYLEIE